MGSIPRCRKGFFPRVNFQCRLFYGVRTPPCATACINICAHVKDLVVHVRVRCVIEGLKHPVCPVGWIARLSSSWLFLGKATQISHGEIRMRQYSCKLLCFLIGHDRKKSGSSNYSWFSASTENLNFDVFENVV